jgi:tRNA G18 (ribose-2'-O)-methylase SpoU
MELSRSSLTTCSLTRFLPCFYRSHRNFAASSFKNTNEKKKKKKNEYAHRCEKREFRETKRDAERVSYANEARKQFGRIDRRALQTQRVLGKDAVLRDVRVVLCEPKIASNVGAIARSMLSFECESLSIVQPRVDVISRASLNASKGAQHIVRNARVFESLEECLEALKGELFEEEEVVGCGSVLQSVAFSRWMSSDEDVEEEKTSSTKTVTKVQKHFFGTKALLRTHPRSVALVFGSEADGLSESQVATCDSVCEYKMGRLIESLSVTHAAVIALNAYFESRVLSV